MAELAVQMDIDSANTSDMLDAYFMEPIHIVMSSKLKVCLSITQKCATFWG